MPIFEFKCLKCEKFFEILIMNDEEMVELNCPECKSENFERVMSATNYAMGPGAGAQGAGVSSKTRSCSSGSCTTYDIPGPG